METMLHARFDGKSFDIVQNSFQPIWNRISPRKKGTARFAVISRDCRHCMMKEGVICIAVFAGMNGFPEGFTAHFVITRTASPFIIFLVKQKKIIEFMSATIVKNT